MNSERRQKAEINSTFYLTKATVKKNTDGTFQNTRNKSQYSAAAVFCLDVKAEKKSSNI